MPFTLIEAGDQPRTSPRRFSRVSRGLAGLLVLSGVSGVLAWLADLPKVAAPLAGWRPMTAGTGVISIVLGLALYQRIRGRREASYALAAGALLLTLPGLFGWVGPGPWQVPLASAVLLATASAGLLSGLLHARPDLEKLVLSITGVGLIALAGTTAFANTLGILGVGDEGIVPGSSIQVVITTGLLGVCFLALVWWTGFREFEPPRWLPAAAGVIGLVTVILFWRALSDRERSLRIEAVEQAADAEQRVLQRSLSGTANAVLRAAEGMEIGVSPVQQERLFLALLRDLPSLQVIAQLDRGGRPVAQAPVTADAAPLTAAWERTATAEAEPDALRFVALDSAQHQFAILVPLCREECAGALAARVDAAQLFARAVDSNAGPFRFSVAGPAGPLPGLPDPGESSGGVAEPLPLMLGPLQWSLLTWPSAATAARRNDLPAAVLFLGLTVSLLVPLTLQLGISAWLGAQERERAQLAFALDRATDGVWEIQLPGGHTVRSRALWNNLGYPEEAVPVDMTGWTALIHPDDQAAVDRAMAQHLSGDRESYEAEYRVKAADGSWHTLVERGRVVERSQAGAPSRMVGISADVTEARAAAIAREESERRFRAVFDSSFQFQILLDASCKVLEANPITLQLAGVQADTVLGQEAWETLWWAGQPEVQQRLRDACDAAGGGVPQSWEQEIHTAGKPTQILELSLRPIRAAGEAVTHMLLEGRDVTERRRVEASLREVDTLTTMGRVAARVAHEINNPLAGIQSAFLLIKDAVPGDHPHHPYVGSIEREIERISRVTRQLYETYRPEQDVTGTSSIHLVVSDAVAFLEQVNRSREVRIVTDLAGAPGTVPVPAAILRQIVYNLAQNAIDASPPGGEVQIAAAANAATLQLTVRDQGPGVPEDQRELIFEPFFSTKGKALKTSGMGLGLSLLRQTVSAAGGTITVGAAAGGGAEFVVILPLDGHRTETLR